jgi:endonuclease III
LSESFPPLDPVQALEAVRDMVREYPPAGLEILRDLGHGSPFELLVACVLSTRTRDEVMVAAARALFHRANTPSGLLSLPVGELEEYVRPVAFPRVKSVQLRSLCGRIITEHAGETPCGFEALVALPGVGPKCANLVLSIACGEPRIAVDSHVHRIANRWGIAATSSPDRTQVVLEAEIPTRLHAEVNALLVPFGKGMCLPVSPRCSACTLRAVCPRVGVARSR